MGADIGTEFLNQLTKGLTGGRASGGRAFWGPSENEEHRIRILPVLGSAVFWETLNWHYSPMGGGDKWICPKEFGELCPMCETAMKLFVEARELAKSDAAKREAVFSFAKAIAAKTSYYAAIVERKNELHTVWRFGPGVFQTLMMLYRPDLTPEQRTQFETIVLRHSNQRPSQMALNYVDLKSGHDILLRKIRTGRERSNVKYEVQLFPEATEAPILPQLKLSPRDEGCLSYKELQSVLVTFLDQLANRVSNAEKEAEVKTGTEQPPATKTAPAPEEAPPPENSPWVVVPTFSAKSEAEQSVAEQKQSQVVPLPPNPRCFGKEFAEVDPQCQECRVSKACADATKGVSAGGAPAAPAGDAKGAGSATSSGDSLLDRVRGKLNK